jgi:hypothetical protein
MAQDALFKMLASWRDDLATSWRSVLNPVELAFDSRAFRAKCGMK